MTQEKGIISETRLCFHDEYVKEKKKVYASNASMMNMSN